MSSSAEDEEEEMGEGKERGGSRVIFGSLEAGDEGR